MRWDNFTSEETMKVPEPCPSGIARFGRRIKPASSLQEFSPPGVYHRVSPYPKKLSCQKTQTTIL
jgi:hypothetical protein